MSYRIKTHGRIGAELQRVADEEIVAAQAELQSLDRSGAGEAVHAARKHFKKMRALVQLLRGPLGARRVRAEQAFYRDAGREFQRLRDAQAQASTLETLARRFFEKRRPPIVLAARRVLAAEAQRARRALARQGCCEAVLAGLRDARRRVSGWKLEDYRWKDLRAALRRSYRRGHEAWRHASAEPKPRALHDWRRRAKDLFYHVTLCHGVAPDFMEELAGDLEVLGEFLGDDHDLVVLRALLERHSRDIPAGHAQRPPSSRCSRCAGRNCSRPRLISRGASFSNRPASSSTPSTPAATNIASAAKRRGAWPNAWSPPAERQNIQHGTPDGASACGEGVELSLDVRCWVLDVGCSAFKVRLFPPASRMKCHLPRPLLPAIAGLFLASCASVPPPMPADPLHPGLPPETYFDRGFGTDRVLCLRLQNERGENWRFLVDSGSPVTIFDRSLRGKLGPVLGTEPVQYAWSGAATLQVHDAPRLFLGRCTLLLTGPRVWSDDLRRVWQGRGIDGILGLDCLRHYCIQLDFTNRTIRFLDPERTTTGPELGHAFPLYTLVNSVFVQGDLLGAGPALYQVDTGCTVDAVMKPPLFRKAWERQEPTIGRASSPPAKAGR